MRKLLNKRLPQFFYFILPLNQLKHILVKKLNVSDLKSIVFPLSLFNLTFCLFKKKYPMNRSEFSFLLSSYYYCDEHYQFNCSSIAANSGIHHTHSVLYLNKLIELGYVERYYEPQPDRSTKYKRRKEFERRKALNLKPTICGRLYRVNRRGNNVIQHFMRCYEEIHRDQL